MVFQTTRRKLQTESSFAVLQEAIDALEAALSVSDLATGRAYISHHKLRVSPHLVPFVSFALCMGLHKGGAKPCVKSNLPAGISIASAQYTEFVDLIASSEELHVNLRDTTTPKALATNGMY